MHLLQDRSLRAAVLGHAATDLLSGQKDILLAALSGPLGLSNSLIGAIGALYQLFGSVLQPAFGFLVDIIGARAVGTIGILWMAGLFCLVVSTPGRAALPLLVVMAVGSAAYHPAGAMEAVRRGMVSSLGREVMATSLFFFFGQAGLALGPAIGGAILESWGFSGLLLLLLAVIPIAVSAGLHLAPKEQPLLDCPPRDLPGQPVHQGRGRMLPYVVVVALRAWPNMGMAAFLPKYYSDMGFRPLAYGAIAALFMMGSALGNLVGGWLGDRSKKPLLVAWSLILSSLSIGLYPVLGPTVWAYLISPLSGGFVGISLSVVVVIGQRLMPARLGMASGFILGIMQSGGAIGILLSGLLADRAGFDAMFLVMASASALGGLMALRLRDV